MSGRFVRASKFRHVYGQPFKKELWYENLKPTLSAFDSNIVQSNGKYISLNANGIGAFIVIPVEEVGKAPDRVPMFRGHTGGAVLDTDFNPFDDYKMASTGEDGKIMLWEIPHDYTFTKNDPEKIVDIKPVASLAGHSRKVGHVKYHPVAENVLATSSFDYTVKIWNLETKKCEVTLKHKDLVTSFSFNHNGTKIATASRDKKLRVWDVRSGELLSEGPGHSGAKASRVCWLGEYDRIVTTGFDRFSERQLGVWNANKIDEGSIGGLYSLDASSGVLMPFYDPSTHLLFVAGKGDGNVRYFEYDHENDELFTISEFQSTSPQRGFAIGPKRRVDIKNNEIVKGYKLLNDNIIEPISFIVPRRAEMFQDDIYPDCPSGVPAQSAEEFFAGKTVDGPLLLSMEALYEGIENPDVTPTVTKKSTESTISEAKKETPKSSASSISASTASSTPASAPALVEKKAEPIKEAIKEEPKPAPINSQKQGVDAVLKQKSVNDLLDKVNALSDDDTQDVDGDDDDDEWNAKPKSSPASAPVSSKKIESPQPVPVVKEEPKPVAKEEPKPIVKEESKPIVKEEPKAVDDASPEPTAKVVTPPASATSSTATGAASKVVGAAGGLKSNVEKLQSLVLKLESTVERLTEQNVEKDSRLKSLEEKIDLLLKK